MEVALIVMEVSVIVMEMAVIVVITLLGLSLLCYGYCGAKKTKVFKNSSVCMILWNLTPLCTKGRIEINRVGVR